MNGIITNIQRFSDHDGPGIRTTVFLKGCSNACAWCHNPETFTRKTQLEFFPDLCIGCGKCFTVCPIGVHHLGEEGHVVNHKACIGCGQCAASCFTGALIMSGKEVTVSEVMDQIRMDEPYYKRSGGGITLSGGEPVLQWEFAKELLVQCKEAGLHTALQTAGNYEFEHLEALLPYLDLVMYDLKAFKEDIYEKLIRGDRERILENLNAFDRKGIPYIVRTPVVGGVNDTTQEIEAVAAYLADKIHMVHYTLIPYHGLGRSKYDALGMDYKNSFYTPEKEQIHMLEQAAARHVKVYNIEIGYINI